MAIRPARPDDAAALSALGEATFRETFMGEFAIPYPDDDLAEWLPRTFGADAFASDIADPAMAVWIAEEGGCAIGYAVAGPCHLPHPEARPDEGELHKLYVSRSAQGMGVGRDLFAAAIGWLEQRHGARLWIGVWSGNGKAQRFYRARGFDKVGDYQYPVGRWRDHEFIFRRG